MGGRKLGPPDVFPADIPLCGRGEISFSENQQGEGVELAAGTVGKRALSATR
jgi:hypothetical protein